MTADEAAAIARYEVAQARDFRPAARRSSLARGAMRSHARKAVWFALISGAPAKQVFHGGAR